jgi:AraC-like DNA-binding protein
MRKLTFSFQLRLASSMILVSSLLSTCLLYGFRPDPARIVVCLVTAVCSISLFPIPDGREVLSLWNSAVLLSLFALGLFCGIPADISIAAIIAYSLLVTVHLARLHIKEHHGRLSFGSAAWTGVMNYSRLMCMCVLSALLCLCPVLAPFGWPLWFEVVLLAGFYVFMHVRAYYGRTFLLTEKQAVEIRRPYPVISASGKTGGQGEAAALRAIYARAVAAFESRRPYLDPDFSQDSFAGSLGVERNSLSQAVGACSGKTFPQFVNAYRVGYAETLIREDPKAKIRDVAVRSGYHNPVTFALAFKAIHGVNPGEYAKGVSARALHSRPSRKQGPER